MAKSFELGTLINPDEEPKQGGVQQRGAGGGVKESASNRPPVKPRPKASQKPAPVQETGKPTGTPKRLSLTLDAETYRRLRLLAVETDRTHQAILEEAARAYLRKHARA